MSNDLLVRAGKTYLSQLKQRQRNFQPAEFRPAESPNFDVSKSKVKLLAYYLPQFHPIPENDTWWGKGFTEWTNVTRALPQFEDHYQPHLPSDLGFYDLRNEAVLEQQVALAKEYGVFGFCMYYYWFGGKRLLERPLDALYRRKDIDFNFCLCWANENWTRRWDGAEAEVLMAQTHSPESDKQFILDAISYMDDPRYIRVDGRPVLVIYRVGLFPQPKETVERWREVAKAELGQDLFLVYAMTFGERAKPSDYGFDAAIQFPPHGIHADEITDKFEKFSSTYSGHIFDYKSIYPHIREQLSQFDFPVIPGVFPCWDNTSRRGEAGNCFHDATPAHYADWLAEAALHSVERPVFDQSFVVINAWNEWAEGAHLEPDQRYGHAYLRATAEVLRPHLSYHRISKPWSMRKPAAEMITGERSPRSRVAIVIHGFYEDVLDDLLRQIPEEVREDVFLSLPDEASSALLSVAARWLKEPNLIFVPNRGRDLKPFLHVLKKINEVGYSYFVKMHTKRSLHRGDGDRWNDELTGPLLATLQNGKLENFLDRHPRVGLVAPAGHLLDGNSFMGSAGNIAWIRRLCREFSIDSVPSSFGFVAGTMFAGRTASLLPLIEHPQLIEMFEEEQGRRDGTLAHALERFIGLLLTVRRENIATIAKTDQGTEFKAVSEALKESYGYAQKQPWNSAAE